MALRLLVCILCVAAVGGQLVDLFSAGDSGYYCFKIPALLATQNGSLLAFAEARKFNCADHTWIDMVCIACLFSKYDTM